MNNTKQKILESCNNLYQKNIINKSQLKSCLEIDSDYQKKSDQIKKFIGDDIDRKNQQYTKLVDNLKKKFENNITQYKNNRVSSIRQPDNCIFKKRANIFKNNLNQLNISIRKEIKNITDEYNNSKYDSQYNDLISNYKDINRFDKEIESLEKKIIYVIEKKKEILKKKERIENQSYNYFITNIVLFVFIILLLLILYKLIKLIL
jgi:hypothetical protein